MKKVSRPQVVTTTGALQSPLPAEIQDALGELVGAAKEGLLALSVGVGLGVVHGLMELADCLLLAETPEQNQLATADTHVLAAASAEGNVWIDPDSHGRRHPPASCSADWTATHERASARSGPNRLARPDHQLA